jgi:hypothetical protein
LQKQFLKKKLLTGFIPIKEEFKSIGFSDAFIKKEGIIETVIYI